MSASKVLPLKCVLNLLTVKPAPEKHHLEEADVEGMQRHFSAICFKFEVENLWTTISCVQLKRLKTLNFGGPHLGVTSHPICLPWKFHVFSVSC